MKQKPIVIVSDTLERSSGLAQSLAGRFNIKLVDLFGDDDFNRDEVLLFIVDIDLNNAKQTEQLQRKLAKSGRATEKIFLTQSNKGAEMVSANKHGARSILMYPYKAGEIETCIDNCLKEPVAAVWSNRPQTEKKALENVASVFEGIAFCLDRGGKLPKADIHFCSDVLISSLNQNGVASWLKAVSQHHSYTYRHCLIVSGIAVAVGLHFGMQKHDVQFLTVSAVLHDIGKIHIPLNILDKPAELTPEERSLIQQHPGHGRDILMQDGQFDEKIIDMVLHHHEFLDGTGYPDGLAGEEISLMVRLLTIVDVYAALIDRRPYKAALSKATAYDTMQHMDGKLDMPLLRAIKPILLDDRVQALQHTS